MRTNEDYVEIETCCGRRLYPAIALTLLEHPTAALNFNNPKLIQGLGTMCFSSNGGSPLDVVTTIVFATPLGSDLQARLSRVAQVEEFERNDVNAFLRATFPPPVSEVAESFIATRQSERERAEGAFTAIMRGALYETASRSLTLAQHRSKEEQH